MCYNLYLFSGASISKFDKLNGLNNNLLSHSSGGYKSNTELWAGLVPSESGSLRHSLACRLYLSVSSHCFFSVNVYVSNFLL